MNRSATSKEQLLETAKEIAYGEGISKLSIRRVASESGIAIGTVYNYYPAKSDLVLAVMEDFWRSVFHRSRFDIESCDFQASYLHLFTSLRENLSRFEDCFLKEVGRYGQGDSLNEKELFFVYWTHMKEGMLKILLRDQEVREDAFSGSFTAQGFIDFAFSNLMILIQTGEESCRFVQMVFHKLIYEAGTPFFEDKGQVDPDFKD